MRSSAFLLVAIAAIALLAALTHNSSRIAGTRVLPTETPSFQTAEPSSPAKVIILGDSISAGCCAPTDQAWPNLLAKRLNADLENLAIGGATSESLIRTNLPFPSGRIQSQLEEALSLLAESDNIVAVTLAIGLNDILSLRDPITEQSCLLLGASACAELIEATYLTYQANLHFIVGELQAAMDPGTPLLMMNYYFESQDWRLNRIILSEINHHGAVLVNVTECFGRSTEQLLFYDGIHSAAPGHRVIADLHTNALLPDRDGDGLFDLMEGVLNSNPDNPDSDGDSCN